MIDEEWLKQIEVDLGEGYRLNGIHVGGTWAVPRVIYPDGKEYALRLPRDLFEFPCYVHELPFWLFDKPLYNVEQLNLKLANLIGDPQVHLVTRAYDRIFTSLLETFYQNKIVDLDKVTLGREGELDNADSVESTKLFRFILQTPAISYRLDDYATSAQDLDKRIWAEEARSSIDRLGPGDAKLCPEHLFDNPLVFWGAAVSEDYFTKAEFPQAAAAVRACFSILTDEQLMICLSQVWALISVSYMFQEMSLSRFAQFCDATEFFQEQFSTEEARAEPDQFGELLAAIKRFDRKSKKRSSN